MTKRAVSATLRAAGFQAARALSSKLRGFRTWGPGFRVMMDAERTIYVLASGETAARLALYQEALAKKYLVEAKADRILITGLIAK